MSFLIQIVLVTSALCFGLVHLFPVPGDSEPHASEPAPKKIKIDLGPRCNLLLSEVKLCAASSDELCLPFIELTSTCATRRGPVPQRRLRMYQLLIVQANPLSVVLFLDFENVETDSTSKYIVIGSALLTTTDISLGDPILQSTFSRTKQNHMLPFVTDSYAVLITQGMSRNEAQSFHLSTDAEPQVRPRILTTNQIKFLQNKVVDMMLLGSGETNVYNQFTNLWKSNINLMLSPNWKSLEDSRIGSSLSVCKEKYFGFDATALEITTETPGLSNACLQKPVETVDSQCTPNNNDPIQTVHNIYKDAIDTYRQQKFDPAWIEACQDVFPKREKILEVERVQSWIHFEMQPTKCKFTCNTCKLYLAHGFRPDIKNKQWITTIGFLNKDIYINGDAIKNHEASSLHKESLLFSQLIKAQPDEDDTLQLVKVIAEFEQKEKRLFNATMNTILLVYAEMKAGIPFQAHETIMKAIRITGSNFGWLQHTNDAAQAMTKTISKTMHNKLLEYLVTNQQPFSIMVDSSTNNNQAFLAVYIQTTADGVPLTHFYSLIHMAQGEKSQPMTDSLIEQIRKDSKMVVGFEEFFKAKLTALVSDGASVMVGENMSFKVYLQRYIGRKIPNVVCLAHRLDSSYKSGIKANKNQVDHLNDANGYESAKKWQLTYFENFEKSTNDFYTFYASRGHKKWLHLLNTAEDLGIIPKGFKYIYPIRWSESHYRALETILHNYFAVVEDLEQMTHNTDFRDSAVKILNLYQQMTDKTYMIVLHEFLDILTTYKIASMNFQQCSSIIVGKIETIYTVLKSLQQYKATPGPHVQGFLSNCVCNEDWHEEDSPLDKYDHCMEVIINNVRLQYQYPVVLSYSDVRQELYNNMISSLRNYFKLEFLEALEIFNPTRLNFQIGQVNREDCSNLECLYSTDESNIQFRVHATHRERIDVLWKYYSMEPSNCNQFTIEWTSLLLCVITTEELNSNNRDPFQFWSAAQRHCNPHWTPLTRELLGKVLVTPYSSSECERGFSVLNSIRTKSRSRLDKDTVDAILTVKINGPEIEDFNSYMYTIEFLKSHVRVDDIDSKNGNSPGQSVCKKRNFLGIY